MAMGRPAWFRPALLYAAAACLITWPLATRLASHLGATEGAGDPYLNVWALGWGMHAWTTDPMSVLTGRVFDANIFFPAPLTLTYSDHLLLQSLIVSPFYAATGQVALCYNLLVLLSIAASGLAMHALVRGVTASTPAAVIAGLAWACWPYRTAHLLHLQLQSLYFLPLALLALHRLAAGRRHADALWLGVCAALQAVSSVYYGVMSAVALSAAAVALALSTGQWRRRQWWMNLLAAAVLAGIVVGPVAWPYWRSQVREGFGRNLSEASTHSASVQSYTQVPPDNLLYGRTGWLAPRAPAPGERDRRHVEHQMFPGLVLVGLALLGVVRGWRSDRRPVAVSATALVIVGVVLSLGPDGIRTLYAWAADWVFGFQAIRAPARFAVVAMAGACVLAGVGVASVRPSRAVAALFAVLLMAEYVNAPLPLVAAPPAHTAAGQWLRDQPAPGAVLYLPLTLDRENTPFMVQSLEHFRPIVNGYSGQRPAFFAAIVDAMSDMASVDARAALHELGVRFVVSPTPVEAAGRPGSPLEERARLADAVIYEVVWTPEREAALDDSSHAELPPPGPAPFARGESATYEAEWLGGPLQLPAGTLTLRTAPAADGTSTAAGAARWQFDAAVDTAEWVSRFFDAHDRFSTMADEQMRPLLHTRTIREGKRRLDVVYQYDHDRGRVRSGADAAAAQSPSALGLPLAPGARDALTALGYFRSLPVAEGLAITIPVNEAGRGLTLDVVVGGREMVALPDGDHEALRITPRVSARVERRQPVQVTMWMSTDGRRLPLIVEVEAGFGRVRLKLVHYEP